MPAAPTECHTVVRAMSAPPSLLCSICQEICKRASKISCCGAQCCWGCGVRCITRARKCWSCPNITVVTGDLVKDTQLREAINRHSLVGKQSNKVKSSLTQDAKKKTVLAEPADAVISICLDQEKEGELVDVVRQSNESKSSELRPVVQVVSNSCTEDFGEEDSKNSPVSNESDKIPSESDSLLLPTSSHIEIRVDKCPSVMKHGEVLTEEGRTEDLIASGTVVNEPEEEIGEVASILIEDKAISGKETEPDVPDVAALSTKQFETVDGKLVCDNNIPEGSNGLIHPGIKYSSKSNSPVKIDLKGSFQKLTEKVKLPDISTAQCETDLEMFEKNTNSVPAPAEEVRIVKMVEDLDKREKIVRIIEELDKTKSLSKRRKSSDVPGPDKRASPPKHVEPVPITNALQGLQALLKMSKMSDPSSSSLKETDTNSSDKKSERSRNVSGTSSKSSNGDQYDGRLSRRNSGSLDHKSRKSEVKARHGDRKDSKSRHSDPPSLTRINRSALVRDRQVETHSKSLVEEQNNKKNVVEDLQAVAISKSGHHDYYEAGRAKNKFQSFQMKDIRKRLLPGSSTINTISSRASDVAKRKGREEDEEVKVLSYRMVKPKTENDENHERVVRKVEDSNTGGKIKSESRKLTSDRVSRKVLEVPKVDVHDAQMEDSIKDKGKVGQSSVTNNINEAPINLFHRSIVNIQSQGNANLDSPPQRRKSLDLIKEELERVTSKVNDIKKKSSSKEISSDDDMTVIMKDVQEMESDVKDISEEVESGRRSKSKKKKHKDDKKKKKKEKYTGDIAIDSRIAKKIISRIISSDMGKSFNEVIKREVGETESTIEKLREDLRKKSSQENKSKKKSKKDKNKEGKEKKKKKKDKHGDEENPRDLSQDRKKKKSKERSTSRSEDVAVASQAANGIEEEVSPNADGIKVDRSPTSKNYKKRKSSSPVRFYDQVPDVTVPESSKDHLVENGGKKSKKIKSDEDRRDSHKKKKSKKKHKRNKEKEDLAHAESNTLVDNQASAIVESKTDCQERIVRKRSSSPSNDFELVLGVAEDDLLDESVVKITDDAPSDSITETETEVDTTIDTTMDENDADATDISTRAIDAALEDIPTREFPAEASISNTNSGATSSANSEDEDDDEDNLRALLLSQLSKTRCGPKTKTKKRPSNHSKASASKITKISWSSPTPEPVEVSSTTPTVPVTTTPSYPPMGSLPVYAYAYSRTFITPAEKLLYFPNLYSRVIVPLDLESDSDSDCQSDCDAVWGEKRTSQWVSDRMQGYSEADPRYSQANLNLVMRGRDSCSPAPL